MTVGYVRVSSAEQNEARQLEAFKKEGVEKIFTEKISGKDMKRPQLQAMLDFVREGDIVYVSDLSRLSRSVADLLRIMEEFERKKVVFVSLKESFDTSTPAGRLMLQMVAAINEFERANILERQREGIEIARRAGVYKGRKPVVPENFGEVYGAWRRREITAVAASRLLSVSRGTFYNLVKKHEEEGLAHGKD